MHYCFCMNLHAKNAMLLGAIHASPFLTGIGEAVLAAAADFSTHLIHSDQEIP